MKSFVGLLKKEFIVSRNWMLTWLSILTVILIATLVLILKYGGVHAGSLYYTLLLSFVGFHFFFIPLAMYSSLHLEGKTMLWLYNPNSSNKLLLAKIFVSTIYLIIAFMAIGIFAAVALMFFDLPDLGFGISPGFIIYGTVYFFLSSLSLAVLITFLWTIYHSLSKFPGLKNVRWLVVLLVFIGLNLLDYFLFERTQLVENYFFNFTLEIDGEIYVEVGGEKINFEPEPFHVGVELFYLIQTIILYIISCILLDRKVEV